MNQRLFVYGTLMGAAPGEPGRLERRRLAREARGLGPATMRGALYDLGDYPGFIPGDAPGPLTHGELFEIAAPALTFPWLDAYEGIVSGAPGPAEYERLILPVTRPADSERPAWVYVYRWDVSAARPVAPGRWTGRRPMGGAA